MQGSGMSKVVDMTVCPRCYNVRWVCEAHPYRPWGSHMKGCTCGAPGEPCPVCNRPDDETAPKMPEGFVLDTKNEDWD